MFILPAFIILLLYYLYICLLSCVILSCLSQVILLFLSIPLSCDSLAFLRYRVDFITVISYFSIFVYYYFHTCVLSHILASFVYAFSNMGVFLFSYAILFVLPSVLCYLLIMFALAYALMSFNYYFITLLFYGFLRFLCHSVLMLLFPICLVARASDFAIC